MLNDKITKSLICPDCGSDMALANNDKSLICSGARRHCYDIASSGYVNLSHTSLSGDSREAVRSRKLFLESGHYDRFSKFLSDKIASFKEDAFIADMGCGEGYYSVNILKALPKTSLVGFDLSKFAVEYASKQARRENVSDRSLFAASSIFTPPLRDASCDVVLNLFAPCCEKEFCRIMTDDALFIIVGAGRDHLIELKSILYDVPRENDERKDLPESMTLVDHTSLRYEFTPSLEERRMLFAMTPYFYRTSEGDKAKLEKADIVPFTAEFDIHIYKKTSV